MKFESDFGSAKTLALECAILVYKGGQDALATIHEVAHSDDGTHGQVTIGPGKLPSPRALKDLAGELFAASGLSYLPPNVLAFSFHQLVWYQPSMLRRIWFGKDTGSKRLTALSGKTARWPALLFSASSRRLAVFALAGDQRPIPSTPLYRAPFPNVEGSHGGVALCSAHPPAHAGIETMEAWERSFYDTEFTHQASGLVNGSYETLWEDMTGSQNSTHGEAEGRGLQSEIGRQTSDLRPPASFPVKSLKPVKLTLDSFLQSKTI